MRAELTRALPIRWCSFFDGERTLSAYLRSDTLQKNDISGIRTPALEAAERDLKARLQQYYRHVKQKDYLAE